MRRRSRMATHMRPSIQSTRRIVSRLLIPTILSAMALPLATGQTATPPSTGSTASSPGKTLAFEVVSIRENKSTGTRPQYGPTPDGWHLTNGPLMIALLTAYVPQTGGVSMYATGQLQGLSAWMMNERYDITAKVAETDLAEWQKHTSQATMLPAMLQSMLTDRCKLVAHRDTKVVPVYSLVLGKNGPKFKEAVPSDPHPGAMPYPGGGTAIFNDRDNSMNFYGAPISSLASLLSNFAGRTVQDKTGLTGLYDILLHRPSIGAPSTQPDGTSDSGSSIFSVVEDLGLKLEPARGSVETLVIDHAERPSEN